ncbi:hypothetical protein OIDMADRAFT_133729 [Oidiodendron maius Zn]|uniref:Enoyl reductase (ER) domain-containing protein n=1 Tax=Oidiodendron maius (strain Zn) TaxID=913774 RepID=A0A0C3GHX9_OIDMZ|nr:hypothetical protein OIDMADRAFT_133729 [Oidiodendron maius Zn]
MSNRGLIYKKCPDGLPIAGEHLAVERVDFSPSTPAPKNGVTLQILYASFDPYLRGRMRDPTIESYAPAFHIGRPVDNNCIAKVVKSATIKFNPGELVIGQLPIQEYAAVPEEEINNIRTLDNPLGIEDIRVFLGALGMPGQTAYSSLYEIGAPKKGETIFISSASGPVGQLVGQLAKRNGLRVIGSVGSDKKLDFIINELGFDGGFNYKKEEPADGLTRLVPEGIDIYFENVGGEHLEAALSAMNNFGRVVACGMISQYNLKPQEKYGVKNLTYIISKRLKMQGFIVSDKDFGERWDAEHQTNVQQWIKDGTIKAITSEVVGIENSAEGLIGLFQGDNFGKAVLRLH